MRIADMYAGGGPVYSFEFFPPHGPRGARSLMRTLADLRRLEPAFVSVTYPLARERRHLTLQLVADIKRDLGLESMAHLTRVNASRDEIRKQVEQLERDGIENVLALGGDPPAPEEIVVPEEEWFPYACDLARFLHERFDFCIGGAAHPETHPRAASAEDDLRHALSKVEAGCEFLITNFFFTNEVYFRYVERARAFGIEVPIVPGIMPVTSVSGIVRMAKLNGASVPRDLLGPLEAVQEDPNAVAEIGVEWARTQCEELVDRDVPGIHFYTLNRSDATRRILSHLRARVRPA
jgi:methylenetetrahydrofolate reductase (NADPH)